MRIRIYNIFILLSLTLVTPGCKKFLEEAPASNEVRIETINDFQDLLMGSAMESSTVNSQCFPTLDLYADDLEQNPSFTIVSTLNSRSYHFTWQPDMWVYGKYGNDGYSLPYDRIKGCNGVLEGVDKVVRATQKQIDIIKAQALTLRAFYYFRMVNMYGKPYNYDKNSPGVILKLSAGIVENGLPRSTVAEVYNQIVKDLTTAIDLFKPYEVTRANYQVNLPAAYVILSRVYLHMEQYDKCIDAATNAINVNGDLTDFTQLSTYKLYSYSNTETAWLYGGSPVFDAASALGSAAGAFIPSASLLSLYDTNDKRLGFFFNATRNNNIKSSSSQTVISSAIRISEAYLNRMEAYVLGNKTTEALSDLNKLRRNRISGYIDQLITDRSTLLTAIRTERRKELCYEQQRWFDLRRYGMPSLQHRFRLNATDAFKTYTLKDHDPLYTLPIPEVYFDNNNQLVQNGSRNEAIRQGN